MSDWMSQMPDPPAAYREAPFWAWNAKLEPAELVRQVGELKRGGMGGFFMHVRYGLETDYLSAEFLDCIKATVGAARQRGMEAWLYDEDRWPSGFAGGAVTADPNFRIKFLACQVVPADQFAGPLDGAVRCFTAVLEGDTARRVRPLPPGEKPRPDAPGDGGGNGRSVVLVYRAQTAGDVGWFNNTSYLDTMNPQAVRAFLDATHEVYKRQVGDEFGQTIPGIFTDEPNFGHFRTWGAAEGVALPWTGRLAVEFRTRFGYDLLDHLVELTHDVEGVAVPVARHNYRRLVTELYTEAFSRQIGQWCAANNLELTGHELSEESLPSQINQVGACMPHYEHFGRPGIDILMDQSPEVLTAKQCVSVASQLGRPRVLSELFGCTGWDATFEMYKHIGDWHQVLGVNHFCPHLSWYSMAGGAKRDYPAGIFYQSPWWSDHKLLGDYFARLSLALCQGRAVREVAVIHPIESAWLVHKKQDASGSDALSQSLERLCVDLLDHQIDFDFADESMLPRHASVDVAQAPPAVRDTPCARLCIGQSAYSAVVVPESITLRKTTVELLEKFADAGGTVVFVGRTPTLMDCQPSDRPGRLADRCVRVPHSIAVASQTPAGAHRAVAGSSPAVLGERCRPVRISPVHRMARPSSAWTHLRRLDDGAEVLFVHHRDRERGRRVRIAWDGAGRIQEIDLMTGKAADLPGVRTADGAQSFVTDLAATGSRLYVRLPGRASEVNEKAAPAERTQTARINLAPLWDYDLDEPNALTLDHCRMRVGQIRSGEPPVDGVAAEQWRPRKLLWRHERDLRGELEFRSNTVAAEQPYVWLRHVSARAADVELEFEVPVEAPPPRSAPLALVLEHPERFEIAVNGKVVKPAGGPDVPLAKVKSGQWFIDRSFRVVPLTGVTLKKGANTITLRTEYREHHFIEEVYLTGRFGVRAAGDRAIVTALPKKLAVGDWVGQGLAMYSGAVTYRQSVRAPKLARGQRLVLCLDRPKATVLRVAVNGKRVGTLGWQPWRLDLTRAVRPGAANRIEITLVSSRRNLLGPLHHALANPLWTGPAEFRTEGPDDSTPTYNLVPYGLLGEVYLSVEQ